MKKRYIPALLVLALILFLTLQGPEDTMKVSGTIQALLHI